MKYEILHGVSLPKIGFGTWRIAGDTAPDPALRHLFPSSARFVLFRFLKTNRLVITMHQYPVRGS